VYWAAKKLHKARVKNLNGNKGGGRHRKFGGWVFGRVPKTSSTVLLFGLFAPWGHSIFPFLLCNGLSILLSLVLKGRFISKEGFYFGDPFRMWKVGTILYPRLGAE